MALKYDQGFRKSNAGDKLYKKWLRIHVRPCAPEFKEFESFCRWALATGFTGCESLMRRDDRKAFTPENCYWVYTEKRETASMRKEWCEKWNRTVNAIRKVAGMPLIEELQEELQKEDKEDDG